VYAWLLLSERPSVTTLLGGALIVAAGLAIIVVDRRTIPPVEVV
jgi:drug/metabolite transporter (DMT)-like permease